MNTKEKITWRDIFNAKHKWCFNITDAIAAAKSVGYPYLEWNGYILRVNDEERVCLTSEVKS